MSRDACEGLEFGEGLPMYLKYPSTATSPFHARHQHHLHHFIDDFASTSNGPDFAQDSKRQQSKVRSSYRDVITSSKSSRDSLLGKNS